MKGFFLPVLVLICCFGIASCAQKSQEKEARVEEAPYAEPPDAAGEAPAQKVLAFSAAGYTTGGKKEWEIWGDSADIFATEQVRLKNVMIKVYEERNPVTITAEEGGYDKASGSAHLEGNVVVTPQDGGRLLTDYLDWEQESQIVKTDAFVQVERENLISRGKGLIGRPELKVVQMNEDVIVEIKDKEDTTKASTVITCDGPLEIDYKQNLAKFFKNVEVSDHRGKLFADRMDVFIELDQEMRKISKVICLGNVRIIRQGSNTLSSKAVYLTDEGKVILTGSPRLVIYPEELEELENQ